MTYHISQCIVPPKYFGVMMCPRGPHLVKCAVIFSILILCPVLHHLFFNINQYLYLSISDSRKTRFGSVCMFSSVMKRDQADFCLQLLRAIFSSKKEKTAERGQWESNWYSLVLFAALFCRNLLTTKTVYLAPNGRFSLEDDVSHEPYFSVLKKSQNCWSNRVEKTKLD